MADTTAITITAIVTTGVASGIIGPAVSARLEARRDERRFRHERVLRDTVEVRQMIDGTADQLDAVISAFNKASSYGYEEKLSLVEQSGVEILDDLEAAVVSLERALSRLIIRVGGESAIAGVCQEVIKVARDIELELMGVSNDLDMVTLNNAPPPNIFEALKGVYAGVAELKELRPSYDMAAHKTAGAIVE